MTRLSVDRVVVLFVGLMLIVIGPTRAEMPTSKKMQADLQFAAANSYRSISKVAVLIDPTDKHAAKETRMVRTLVEAQGWSLIEATVPVNTEGGLMTAGLADTISELADQNPQWLYLGVGKFFDANVSLIAREAMAHGLPILASREAWVRDGYALISVTDFSKNLRSQKLIPVVINIDVASRLKQFPPLLMLRNAEIISHTYRRRE